MWVIGLVQVDSVMPWNCFKDSRGISLGSAVS